MVHPPTSQTRRHQGTKTSRVSEPQRRQERKVHTPAHRRNRRSRRFSQMVSTEIRARSEVPAVVGRRPGTAGTNSSSDRKRSSLGSVPAACGPRAQTSPLLPCCSIDGTTLFKNEEGQAEPTRPGRVGRWEERQRRTLASGVGALSTGRGRSSDRRRFRRQSSALPHQGDHLRSSA